MKEETEDNIKSIIDRVFEYYGEDGVFEIFKGIYLISKKGSVAHAQFIMKYYFDEQSELGDLPKEFELVRTIIDNEDQE